MIFNPGRPPDRPVPYGQRRRSVPTDPAARDACRAHGRGEDDLPAGDLLIRGDTIEAVGPDLSQLADNATICADLSGYIVCPGFNDSHVHA